MEISNLRQDEGQTALLEIEKVLRKGETYKEMEISVDPMNLAIHSLPPAPPPLGMLPVASPHRDGQLAARASRVLLEAQSSACPRLCPPCFFPGSSFAFHSLSFPRVGLVSGPDPVQYLSPGSAICSHFHMFNIHISCLLPCPIAVTGSFSLSLGPRATGHPVSTVSLSSPPGEYWGSAA